MTWLVERLAELRRHLEHLRELRPKVSGAEALEEDMSLHNDVLFSLLSVAQLVIDVAGELSSRAGLTFDDYTSAVRNLRKIGGFPDDLVEALSRLPGFRNVLLHEYLEMDLAHAVRALDELEPVDDFVRIVAGMLEE